MVKVLINQAFRDKYTGKEYEASSELIITKERANEIISVDKNLITILCEVKDKKSETPNKVKDKKSENEDSNDDETLKTNE